MGRVFERARKDKRLTQAEVAAAAGVRQSVIGDYESGNTTPSLSVLIRVMLFLRVEFEELARCLRYDYKRKPNADAGERSS